ncbi:unnamed protein product [Cuscuta campestris]|uniref:Uncharacterized protein n=1 Tax=Cuscuta campestris TaxID=132261 RepID=A0A484KNA6_9ASTE|nr:unnamed protein product [Cuscuta campestris]
MRENPKLTNAFKASKDSSSEESSESNDSNDSSSSEESNDEEDEEKAMRMKYTDFLKWKKYVKRKEMANDKENNNENSKSKRTTTGTNDKDNGSNKNKARSLFTSANDKQNDSAKSLFTGSKDKDNFNDKNKASSKFTGSLGAVLKGYKEQVARRLNEKAPNPQTPTNNNLPLNFTSILDKPSPPTYAEAHTTSPDIHDSNVERQDDFLASETSEQLMGSAQHSTSVSRTSSKRTEERGSDFVGGPSDEGPYDVYVVEGEIVLTENASKVITQSFHLRLDPEGSSWSGVTPETLSFYWEEFKQTLAMELLLHFFCSNFFATEIWLQTLDAIYCNGNTVAKCGNGLFVAMLLLQPSDAMLCNGTSVASLRLQQGFLQRLNCNGKAVAITISNGIIEEMQRNVPLQLHYILVVKDSL